MFNANLEVATGQVIAQLDRPAQKLTFWLIFSRLLLLTQQVFGSSLQIN